MAGLTATPPDVWASGVPGPPAIIGGRGIFNVRDFGAVGSGAVDETPAVQAAANAALAAGGGIVYFPNGTYSFAAASLRIDPGAGGISFVGQSRLSTVLLFNAGNGALNSGTEKYLFYNNQNITKKPLHFENLKILGTLDVDLALGGGNAMQLWYYPQVTIRDCWFDQIKAMATDMQYCGRFECTGTWFTNIALDACRARDTKHIVATNNFFQRTGDDAMAFHTVDNTAETFFPIREGILIANNHLINAGSIKVMGARAVSIHNNRCKLSNGTAIWVLAGSGTEGHVAQFDIQVTDNVIEDCVAVTSGGVASAATAAIVLEIPTPRGVAATNNVIPGRYDATSAAFIKPWNWYQKNQANAANAIPPTPGVRVSGNTYRRTLPTAAAFSDYGYGTVLKTGLASNPATTDAVLRPTCGLQVAGVGLHEALITDNVFSHVSRGLGFSAPTANGQFSNIRILGNVLHDCLEGGIVWTSGAFDVGATIDGNTFDIDPYRVGASSNIDGSYAAFNANSSGINLGSIKGVAIKSNVFKNCNRPIASNNPTDLVIANNIGVCSTPAAVGYNAGNKGIGTIDADNGWRFKIVDSDPTSGTWGAYSSTMITDATAMPTSGWYYRGWFVRDTSTAIGTGKVRIGWARMTTGTAHVLNTDWAQVYGTNA